MPDITMCQDNKCDKRKKCYRYTAEPSEYQSYFIEPPKKPCEYYYPSN